MKHGTNKPDAKLNLSSCLKCRGTKLLIATGKYSLTSNLLSIMEDHSPHHSLSLMPGMINRNINYFGTLWKRKKNLLTLGKLFKLKKKSVHNS